VEGSTTTSTTDPAPVPAVAAKYVPPTPVAVASPPPTTTTTTTTTPPPPPAYEQTGEASWYWAPAGTCASPGLAFGTVVRVTDLSDGLSTTCTVDDRGPAVAGRIIDLSEETFSQLTSTAEGVIEVRISW
jgi:rare lipoprotein A